MDYSAANAVTKKTSYYPGGAMRVDVVGGSNTLYYLLKDHLGSASTLLDTSGNLVTNGEQRYYPFGESRLTSADLKTDHLFTGQLSVGLGGIYHYGARFYSSKLGRFLSADTVVPDWTNPQSLNRFSYTYNNPLKYVDPTGHRTECSGTGDFISESTGDGGISWASCWGLQAKYHNLRNYLVTEILPQKEAGEIDDLGLMEQLLVTAFDWFGDNYLQALRAATAVVREGGVVETVKLGPIDVHTGFGFRQHSDYFGKVANETAISDTGFGELKDVDHNQVSHFIGEAYIAYYQLQRSKGYADASTLILLNEGQNIFGQSLEHTYVDIDLGMIANQFARDLYRQGDPSSALSTAIDSIRRYDYESAHPARYPPYSQNK